MDSDDQEIYLEELIQENVDFFEPLCNFLYPLPNLLVDPATAQSRLFGLNVVVVLVDEEPYLALSACGMDLSWDICRAYMVLGYYPPIHFCDLPDMGLSHDRKELEIISAMVTSLDFSRSHLSHSISRLRELETRMIEREARRKS